MPYQVLERLLVEAKLEANKGSKLAQIKTVEAEEATRKAEVERTRSRRIVQKLMRRRKELQSELNTSKAHRLLTGVRLGDDASALLATLEEEKSSLLDTLEEKQKELQRVRSRADFASALARHNRSLHRRAEV